MPLPEREEIMACTKAVWVCMKYSRLSTDSSPPPLIPYTDRWIHK
jgi:hypothetical protein